MSYFSDIRYTRESPGRVTLDGEFYEKCEILITTTIDWPLCATLS